MKYIVLSIGLLLSYSALQSMDKDQTITRSPLIKFFEKQDHNGNTVLHTTLMHYKDFQELDALASNSSPATESALKEFNKKSPIENPLAHIKGQWLTVCLAQDALSGSITQTVFEAGASTMVEYKKNMEDYVVTTIKNLGTMGFNFNLQNKDGETALYLAAKYQAISAVKSLLDHKADPNIKNNEKESPLEVAAYSNHNPDIIRNLLSHGAEIRPLLRHMKKVGNTSYQNMCVITTHLQSLPLDKQNMLALNSNDTDHDSDGDSEPVEMTN